MWRMDNWYQIELKGAIKQKQKCLSIVYCLRVGIRIEGLIIYYCHIELYVFYRLNPQGFEKAKSHLKA